MCVISRLHRIVLKSNCDTPIDVWLVSGHHQHQQKEDDEVAFDNPHAAMPAVQVKHEADGLAGQMFCMRHAECQNMRSLALDRHRVHVAWQCMLSKQCGGAGCGLALAAHVWHVCFCCSYTYHTLPKPV